MQSRRNLLVREAVGHEPDDLPLANTQSVGGGGTGSLRSERQRDRVVDAET
jgi:hypothetical protein